MTADKAHWLVQVELNDQNAEKYAGLRKKGGRYVRDVYLPWHHKSERESRVSVSGTRDQASTTSGTKERTW
ncbi:MAG: hypothetical protein A3A51_04505 [Candidatus Levybacteria bacterium RIFCSPLOWO2_01_FULL_39_10]|nr:MAG: hypothetical protein A3A51_04505 [Candidatus Levybacteria bacterium RIFCSPLOWO2_01_FULL_39_10]